ncbi:MAG TPA: TPM domain-containing protein [Tenuifilaceae bacterium]|nr:TPM domain-containing protein [Tenuifilaceae bacterium]HPE17307.1 TPM domain-containing protein [Tenuifilaceae bacterium]HPJ44533.1 TPM domain-containing protein [Tenuifilaceae bacterium]HPQ33071.1 TPM domain-containing protein [Tenuifilaceae bacterium]HRX67615.1 TPM domain-containing protein [Tenuifilaceae bacterium]
MAAEKLRITDKVRIVNAVKQAELNTSGEIRIHIEDRCKGNVLDRAADVFAMLKMHKTEQRNGVLFYLALDDKQFAILGDAGINAVVPANFWESIKEEMMAHFKNGEFADGLVKGVEMAGEKLKQHFPYQSDDINELPNDISFGS